MSHTANWIQEGHWGIVTGYYFFWEERQGCKEKGGRDWRCSAAGPRPQPEAGSPELRVGQR